MKILLISPCPPPIGGIAAWTVDYLKEMPKLGIDVLFVNSGVTGKRVEDISKVSLLSELRRILLIRKNIRIKMKEHPEVVHYNASCFALGLIRDYIVLKAVGKKTPVVYHCHCSLKTNINNKLAEFFFKKICISVSKVLVLNSESKAVAEKYTEKVSVIPNFVKKLFRDRADVRNELKDVVFVGHVYDTKGINEFVNASKKMPEVNFHVVGEDAKGKLSGIKMKNLIYHGEKPHDEIPGVLKKADAFILPSYTEGFPIAALEAMACGLPVIATNVGAIPDMIDEPLGGILIPAGNSDAVVEAVKKIAPVDLRRKMAEHNIEKVRDNYMCGSVMQKLKEIYGQCMVRACN